MKAAICKPVVAEVESVEFWHVVEGLPEDRDVLISNRVVRQVNGVDVALSSALAKKNGSGEEPITRVTVDEVFEESMSWCKIRVVQLGRAE